MRIDDLFSINFLVAVQVDLLSHLYFRYQKNPSASTGNKVQNICIPILSQLKFLGIIQYPYFLFPKNFWMLSNCPSHLVDLRAMWKSYFYVSFASDCYEIVFVSFSDCLLIKKISSNETINKQKTNNIFIGFAVIVPVCPAFRISSLRFGTSAILGLG